MKKHLFLFAAAAVALASCSSDDTIAENSSVSSNQQKEIMFAPIAQPSTRAAVDGTGFPTTSAIQVAAYDVTNSRNFFTHTTFSYSGAGTIWKGGKYWPLSAAYINFLGYTNFQGTAGSETSGATWASDEASQVTLVMTDNMSAQKDLMYAIGNGEVTQSGNTLTFPPNVPMVFKHAQSWISFYADAYDATSGGQVTLNKITLNGASYAGTFIVTHTNYDATSSQSVAGEWSSLGAKGTDDEDEETSDVTELKTPNTKIVPGWTSAAVAYDSSGDGVVVGDGLLIVPDDNALTDDFVSFTINYTLGGNTYDYTYTPATRNVDQAKHYIYNINFHLHEIEISATVTDWLDQTPVAVPIY